MHGSNEGRLSIIPLGGLGEIGKNSTVIECGRDIILIDAGLAFPDDEMLGIDIVIPDFSYVYENKERVRAIVLTHGHEDHIGALPYLLQELDVPVYGTKLTLGLVRGKLAEHGMALHPSSMEITPDHIIDLGQLQLEFFRVNHSIADAVGVAVATPQGLVVHSGDFKFDQTPIDGNIPGYHKLANLGDRGVLALLSDSTNAERPGYTLSERTVGDALDEIVRVAEKRVMVATFASNVPRIQQVLNAAEKSGRKVGVVGRSMENVVDIALDLGYLSVPANLIWEVQELQDLPPDNVVLLTTGSQGEPFSALTRIGAGTHRHIKIEPGDTVIMAATPVPGNEKLVARVINNLYRHGAHVHYNINSGVHVSGHASREELKLMINLVKPDCLIPVHGEYRHLVHHAELARDMCVPEVLVAENGDRIVFDGENAWIDERVNAGPILVDGLGVGDVGNVVLRDRQQLAEDGIVVVVLSVDSKSGRIVAGPDILSRGFVYIRESEHLMLEAQDRVAEGLKGYDRGQLLEWASVKSKVREVLNGFFYEKTRRRPMVLPIVMEV